MNRNVPVYFFLAVPSVYLFASLWANMLGDPFPVFNDPGIWLKLAHAITGNTYPMWGETTYQYPPFFPALVALFSSLTGNDLVTLKILGAAAIAVIPLSSYPMTKSVTGSATIAVVGAWLVAFAPIFQEMFGWGGYPDALAIAFLTLAMGYAVISYNSPSWFNYTMTFVFSFLTAMTHHLTFIIFAGGFGIATLILLLITKERKKFYAPLAALAGGGLGFLLWRVLAGPFQYVLYNGASLAIRPLDIDAMQFTFKNFYLLGALLILAAFGGAWLYKNKKYFELVLLVSVAVVPYLAGQAYLIGIALDFRRFPAFSAVPLSVLAAISLGWMRGIRSGVSIKVVRGAEARIEGSLAPVKVGLALLFVFLFLGTIVVGVATEGAVFAYYHAQTDYTYAGTPRLQAINWIRANTSRSAVIVADTSFGRWTEGYGQRRVLMDLEPYQSFITDEVPRAIAANLILSGSNVEIANPFIQIEDGTPNELGLTPVFAWSDGLDYHPTIHVTDAYVRADFFRAGSNWTEAPYNPSSFSMGFTTRTANNVTFAENFETNGLIFNKSMSVGLYAASARVTYEVTPRNGSVLHSLALPIWIPYGDYGTFASIGPAAYSISDNGVPMTVTPVGNFRSALFGVDNSTGEQRLLLTFAPVNNRITAGFVLTFNTASPIAWRSTLDSYVADQLITQYSVNYIAVGIYHYDISKYRSDPRFSLVYENAQIAIFQVVSP